jgi:ABC-2 type transport system permease protein
MRQILALFRREFIEHRGAFYFAPAILLGVFTFGAVLSTLSNRVKLPFVVTGSSALKIFELSLMFMAQLWWLYLLVALFFYYADAFSADRRNNAMLFWKSMPLSDLKILSAKMLAGLTVFPALNFGFVLLTGVVLYLVTILATLVLPHLVIPPILDVATTFAHVAWFALVYIVLGVLWYAPFLAWVGALSTVFRRWAIPLSILIPVVLSVLENAVLYGNEPNGGYIYSFLWDRLHFGFDLNAVQYVFLTPTANDAPMLLQTLSAGMNWISLAGGLVVAALLVYAASQYRRRRIDT